MGLSRDIADNRGVLIGKGGGATIVLTGVTLIAYEGMEVVLIASEVDDDGALDNVVVDVIGKGDEGVMLMICEGMEVVLTVSKVNDDGAFDDVIDGVVCMHDSSLYPSFLL